MRIVLASLLLALAACDDNPTLSSSEAVACGITDDDDRLTADQCACAGGTIRTDPGDGSGRCEDDETFLGFLDFGIEPVLCCL